MIYHEWFVGSIGGLFLAKGGTPRSQLAISQHLQRDERVDSTLTLRSIIP